jgi:hypothetical protein
VTKSARAGEDYWRLVEPHWERVSIYDGETAFRREYDKTPERSRHLLAAHWCVSEVRNGGLDQFFSNPTGILAPEAAQGFRAIGLPKLATLLRQAMDKFGSPYPRNRERRQAALVRVQNRGGKDDAFKLLDDRFFDLLEAAGGGFEAAADAYARGSGG